MDELTATELKQYWPVIESAVLRDGARLFATADAASSTPAERRIVLAMATLGASAVLHAVDLYQQLQEAGDDSVPPAMAVRHAVLAVLREQLDIREEQEVVHRLADGLDWPDAPGAHEGEMPP